MQVKQSVEMPDGTYVYQGSITGKELDFLVEYAINTLLMQGALPFLSDESEAKDALVLPEHDTAQ